MNRSRLLTIALGLSLVCAAPSSAHASSFGNLDPTFGKRGQIQLPRGDLSPVWDAMVRIQRDETILVAINSRTVMRLRRNGRIDRKFGSNGRAKLTSGFQIAELKPFKGGRVAVLLNRMSGRGVLKTQLVMLKSNGRRDRSFANGGTLTLGSTTSGLRARSMAVQDGSKLLLAGALDGSTTNASLMRINVDGSTDLSFGTAGFASVPVTPAGSIEKVANDSASALTVNGAGEILLGIDQHGVGSEYNEWTAGVAKLDRNGAPIRSFGIDGVAPLATYLGHRDGVTTIAVSARGTILAIALGGAYSARGSGLVYTTNYLNADGGAVKPPTYGGFHSAAVTLPDVGFATLGFFGLGALLDDFSVDPRFDGTAVNKVVTGGDCTRWSSLDSYRDGRIISVVVDGGVPEDNQCGVSGSETVVVRTLGPRGGKAVRTRTG